MLSSSSRFVGEAPVGAARRILDEQTDLTGRTHEDVVVRSSVDAAAGVPAQRHWHLELLYPGTAREGERTSRGAGTERALVGVRTPRPETVSRAEADLRAFAGAGTA